MPVQRCTLDAKPGWRFGDAGKCYVYTAGDNASEAAAKKQAIAQGLAIGGGKPPAEGLSELYRVRLSETIKAGDTTPMMVFPIGEWHSHRYPSLPLTEELANELIANFESGILGTEPVVDSSGKHDTSAPAAGWVKRVYLASYEEGDVTGLALWADVKWTALGATMLSAELYKYGSVEIGPVTMNDSGDEVDNVLRSLTLTNTPVLRLMPGVRNAAEKQRVAMTLSLSEVTAAEPGSTNEEREALEAVCQDAYGAMNESVYIEDFGPDWVVFHTYQGGEGTYYRAPYAKTENGTTLGTPVEVKRETTYVPVSDSSPAGAQTASSPAYAVGMADEGHGAHLSEGDAARRGADPMKTVINALKLAEGADESAIHAAVVKLAEERDTETKRADDATAKLAEVEKTKRAGEVAVELTEIEKLGNLTPGEKPEFVTLAEDKPDVYAARVAERKALPEGTKIKFGEAGTSASGSEASDDPTVAVDLAAKKLAEERSIPYGEAMTLALAEDPALAGRYHNRDL